MAAANTVEIKIVIETRQASDNVKDVNAKLNETSSIMDKLSKMGNIFAGVKAAADMVMSAFGSISGTLEDAQTQFSEFETALTDMGKVTDIPAEQIKKDIMSIDPVLGDSTSLMKGYYQTISAGISEPSKALEFLTGVAKSASAAHVSQEDAIKALSKTMAGFGGEIKSVTEASDLLFAIEKAGQTSFQELVPIMGDLAGMSKQAGVSSKELGGSLALLTQTSGGTSQAATKYKAVISSLLSPTETLETAIKKSGFASGEAMIKQLGLADTLSKLKDYAEKSGLGLGKLFSSQEALVGVASLSAEGFTKVKDSIDAVGNSAGMSEKAFKKWKETAQAGDVEIKAMMTNLKIAFGEVIDKVAGQSNIFESIVKWAYENKDILIAAAKTVGDDILNVVSRVKTSITEFIGSIDKDTLISFFENAYSGAKLLAGGLDEIAKVAGVLYGGRILYSIFVGLPAVIEAANAFLLTFRMSLYSVEVASIAAAGGVTALKGAVNLLFAGFVGWEIGSYLYEEFESVRLIGLALVDSLITGWINVESVASVVFASIQGAFASWVGNALKMWQEFKSAVAIGLAGIQSAFGAVQGALGTMHEKMASAASMVGASDMASDFTKIANSLKASAENAKPFAVAISEVNKQKETELARIDANTKATIDNATKTVQNVEKIRQAKLAEHNAIIEFSRKEVTNTQDKTAKELSAHKIVNKSAVDTANKTGSAVKTATDTMSKGHADFGKKAGAAAAGSHKAHKESVDKTKQEYEKLVKDVERLYADLYKAQEGESKGWYDYELKQLDKWKNDSVATFQKVSKGKGVSAEQMKLIDTKYQTDLEKIQEKIVNTSFYSQKKTLKEYDNSLKEKKTLTEDEYQFYLDNLDNIETASITQLQAVYGKDVDTTKQRVELAENFANKYDDLTNKRLASVENQYKKEIETVTNAIKEEENLTQTKHDNYIQQLDIIQSAELESITKILGNTEESAIKKEEIEKNFADVKKDLNQQLTDDTKKMLDNEVSFYKETFGILSEQYYQKRLLQIEDEKQQYISAGRSKEDAAAWANKQISKLDKERFDEQKKNNDDIAGIFKDIASGNVSDWQDMIFKMSDLFGGFLQDSNAGGKSAFGDLFSWLSDKGGGVWNALKGGFGAIKGIFTGGGSSAPVVTGGGGSVQSGGFSLEGIGKGLNSIVDWGKGLFGFGGKTAATYTPGMAPSAAEGLLPASTGGFGGFGGVVQKGIESVFGSKAGIIGTAIGGSMVGSIVGLFSGGFSAENIASTVGSGIGSLFGPIGTVLGGALGNLVGSLFKKDPKITMKHLGVEKSGYNAETGVVETKNYGRGGDYRDLLDAGDKALNEVTANTNTQITKIRETLTGSYLDKFNKMLAEQEWDASWFEKNYNWDVKVKDAKEPLEKMITAWAARNTENLNNAYAVVLEQKIAESDISKVLTQDSIQKIMSEKAYDDTGKELGKTESLQQAMTKFTDIENYVAGIIQTTAEMGITVEGLTQKVDTYKATQEKINTQYDEWKSTLTQLGVKEEIIANVEKTRATALDNLAKQYEAQRTELINQFSEKYGIETMPGVSKYDISKQGLDTDLKTLEDGLISLGMSAEDANKKALELKEQGIAGLEKQFTEARENIIKEFSEKYNIETSGKTDYQLVFDELAKDTKTLEQSLIDLGMSAEDAKNKAIELNEQGLAGITDKFAKVREDLLKGFSEKYEITPVTTEYESAFKILDSDLATLKDSLINAGMSAENASSQINELGDAATTSLTDKFAKTREDLMAQADDLAGIKSVNPFNSAIKTVNTSFNELTRQMINAGASAEELASIETKRTLAYNEAVKNVVMPDIGADTISGVISDAVNASKSQLESNKKALEDIKFLEGELAKQPLNEEIHKKIDELKQGIVEVDFADVGVKVNEKIQESLQNSILNFGIGQVSEMINQRILSPLMNSMMDGMLGEGGFNLDTIQSSFEKIQGLDISGLTGGMTELFTALSSGEQVDFAKFAEKYGTTFEQIQDMMTTTVDTTTGEVPQAITAMAEEVKTGVQTALEGVNVFESIQTAITGNIDTLEQNFDSTLSDRNVFDGLVANIQDAITTLGDKINSMTIEIPAPTIEVTDNAGAISHATGSWHIPQDNYLANLHEGEMVIRKEDAEEVREFMYNKGKTSKYGGKISFTTGGVPSFARGSLDISSGDFISKPVTYNFTPSATASPDVVSDMKEVTYDSSDTKSSDSSLPDVSGLLKEIEKLTKGLSDTEISIADINEKWKENIAKFKEAGKSTADAQKAWDIELVNFRNTNEENIIELVAQSKELAGISRLPNDFLREMGDVNGKFNELSEKLKQANANETILAQVEENRAKAIELLTIANEENIISLKMQANTLAGVNVFTNEFDKEVSDLTIKFNEITEAMKARGASESDLNEVEIARVKAFEQLTNLNQENINELIGQSSEFAGISLFPNKFEQQLAEVNAKFNELTLSAEERKASEQDLLEIEKNRTKALEGVRVAIAKEKDSLFSQAKALAGVIKVGSLFDQAMAKVNTSFSEIGTGLTELGVSAEGLSDLKVKAETEQLGTDIFGSMKDPSTLFSIFNEAIDSTAEQIAYNKEAYAELVEISKMSFEEMTKEERATVQKRVEELQNGMKVIDFTAIGQDISTKIKDSLQSGIADFGLQQVTNNLQEQLVSPLINQLTTMFMGGGFNLDTMQSAFNQIQSFDFSGVAGAVTELFSALQTGEKVDFSAFLSTFSGVFDDVGITVKGALAGIIPAEEAGEAVSATQDVENKLSEIDLKTASEIASANIKDSITAINDTLNGIALAKPVYQLPEYDSTVNINAPLYTLPVYNSKIEVPITIKTVTTYVTETADNSSDSESLAVGSWNIPKDNFLANLHENEMVIKEEHAPAVRTFMKMAGYSEDYGVPSFADGMWGTGGLGTFVDWTPGALGDTSGLSADILDDLAPYFSDTKSGGDTAGGDKGKDIPDISALLESIEDMLNKTSDLDKELRGINKTWDKNIEQMKLASATEEQLADAEKVRNIILQQARDEQQEQEDGIKEQIKTLAYGEEKITDYDKALKETSEKFDNLKEQYKKAGASAEELTGIEALRTEALKYQEKLLKEQRNNMISDISDKYKPDTLTDYDKALKDVNNDFDKLITELKDSGLTADELTATEALRTEALKYQTEILEQQQAEILKDITDFADSFNPLKKELSEYEKDLADIDSQFEKITEEYKNAGASAKEISGLEILKTQAQIYAQEKENARIRADALEKEKRLSESLSDALKSITESDLNIIGLTASQQRKQDKTEYTSLKTKAETTKSEEDIQAYLDFSSQYLQSANDDLKSSKAYQQIYKNVLSDISGFGSVIDNISSDTVTSINQEQTLPVTAPQSSANTPVNSENTESDNKEIVSLLKQLIEKADNKESAINVICYLGDEQVTVKMAKIADKLDMQHHNNPRLQGRQTVF